MLERLKKTGNRNISIQKEYHDIKFVLEIKEKGPAVEVYNGKNIIKDYDFKAPDRDIQSVVNIIRNSYENPFDIDWGSDSEVFYIEKAQQVMEYLKKTGLYTVKGEKIEFIDKKLPLKAVIESDGGNYNISLMAGDEKSFIPLSERYILAGDAIFEVEMLGGNYSELSLFNEKIDKENLERYLSLLFSYFNEIDIEFEDYEIVDGGQKITEPVIVFEKIDSEKTLFLRAGHSAGELDFNFFNDYDISFMAVVNELEKKIIKNKITANENENPGEYIQKLLSKIKKQSLADGDFYSYGNTFIIEEGMASEFLRRNIGELLTKYRVMGAEKLDKYKIKAVKPKLGLSLSHGIDYFEGNAYLEFDDTKISLFDAINEYKKNSYITLSDGTNVIVNKNYFDKLERIFKKNKENVKISFFDLPLVEELIEERVISEKFPRVKEVFMGFNSIREKEAELPKINLSLREYQEYGFKWMRYLYENNLGGCLADDMGLGKTAQAITLLSTIYPASARPSLIVMPTTLLFNWEAEIKKFNPAITFASHYGTNRNFDEVLKNNVILTTYGTLRNDIEKIKEIEFEVVILDESQNIKNYNALSTKAAMILKSKQRFALSGTPVENNLGELYSLFKFINPSMFGTIDEFNKNYAVPIQKYEDKSAMKELRTKIYPFILRRTKKEVLKDLPEKIEQTLYVEMETAQAKLYEERRIFYYDAIKNQIEKDGINKSQFFILQALSELRQLATNPEGKTDGRVVSAKRELLAERITDAVSNNHKLLIFTNFLNVVENIEADLDGMNIKYLTITGAVTNRKELVEKFQEDKSIKVFILTLKTGGTGLNLTSADTVFIYDPWWNKSAENQAIDRSHRIGQDKTVFSYKLITKGTIEEKILQLQEKKEELFANLLASDGASVKNLTEDDVEFILGE